MPTTFGRNHVAQASGTMPRRENTKPNRADVLASRMSMGSSMVAPRPAATPFTAAITGLVQAKIRKVRRPPPSRKSATSSAQPRSFGSKVLAPPETSAPAQNALPAPVTTTAPTSGSASTRSKASMSSSRISVVTEFSRSGRFSVIVATRSSTA